MLQAVKITLDLQGSGGGDLNGKAVAAYTVVKADQSLRTQEPENSLSVLAWTGTIVRVGLLSKLLLFAIHSSSAVYPNSTLATTQHTSIIQYHKSTRAPETAVSSRSRTLRR